MVKLIVGKTLTPQQGFEILPKKLLNFFIRYPPQPFKEYATKPVSFSDEAANPFIANKNPATNKYRSAQYSKRRQSDLFKLARKFGVEDCLPPIVDKQFGLDKYYNRTLMRGILTPKMRKVDKLRPEKQAATAEAIENADETILGTRGYAYKKKLEKREKNKKTWF